jgi:hypothetical protein
MNISRPIFAMWILAAVTPGRLALAQQPTPTPQLQSSVPAGPQPAANPSDVSSPKAILAAAYDAISGPATKDRDWDRLRSLFLPGARLIQSSPDQSGKYTTTVLSLDDFIAAATPYFKQGAFYERESASHADRYGNIMQVFSTYESSLTKNGKPFARGINSFQLLYKDNRWWIVTIFWQEEDHDFPIPAKYLPAKK